MTEKADTGLDSCYREKLVCELRGGGGRVRDSRMVISHFQMVEKLCCCFPCCGPAHVILLLQPNRVIMQSVDPNSEQIQLLKMTRS